MSYALGIDIGTYESKGVLVDGEGEIKAIASRSHRLKAPRPDGVEHDAEADWWGDFVQLTRSILADSRIDPREIKAIGCSATGPCMLPVNFNGAPLMKAALYGIDTRASAEVEKLSTRIGVNRLIATGGNALTSQAVGPKILWLRRNHPEIFSKMTKILSSTTSDTWREAGSAPDTIYAVGGITKNKVWLQATSDITGLPQILRK
jgi:xylulokinase